MLLAVRSYGQDTSTGALRGVILDPSGGQIAGATVVVVNSANGFRYSVSSDADGRFAPRDGAELTIESTKRPPVPRARCGRVRSTQAAGPRPLRPWSGPM